MSFYPILKNAVLMVFTLLAVSCSSIRQTPMEMIAEAFMDYKGPGIVRDDFSISQQEPVSTQVFDNGYRESDYFVFYWPSRECVEGYTVFEKCKLASSCKYQFEWVEGVCD